MKIVFFGTPPYVLPVLETIHKAFKVRHESPIAAVVTQRPRPSGRKQILTYSEMDHWAHKRAIPKLYTSGDLVEQNIQADIGILAAYGEIIPENVINHFPHGILNIHPSLLPRFRGASPVQATIVSGEEAGVTIIKMDEKLDHGPIVAQFKDEILSDDTTESLRERLFLRASEVLKTLIPAYISGKIRPKPQDHSTATFTRQIDKDDAQITGDAFYATLQGDSFKGRWEIPFAKDFAVENPEASDVERYIRAMYPWPIAWTKVKLSPDSDEVTRLILHKAHLEKSTESGTRKTAHKLVPDEVQLASKNPVSWKQFTEAYPEAMFS